MPPEEPHRGRIRVSGAQQASGTATLGHRAAIMSRSAPRAMAASVLLHAAIAIAIWNFERVPASAPYPAFDAIPIELRTWIELPRRNALELPPAEPALESIEVAPPQPATAVSREPGVDDVEIADDHDAGAQTSLETIPPSEEISSAPSGDAPVPPPLAPLVPRGYDFEAARADAVARVVEAIRAESEYRTFSLDDLPGNDDADTAGPFSDGPDLFAAAAELRSNGVLSKRRARSRLVRTIIDLCNELTGGFSIQGLFNVCANPGARADLFGHLRPQYMESVPLCSADEELDIEVVQGGAGAVGSFKCVLVSPEARRDLYSRYDPDLAGWVPSPEQDRAAGTQ